MLERPELAEVEKLCRLCGKPFMGLAAVPIQQRCPACIDTEYAKFAASDLADWRASLNLDEIVLTKLGECGLSEVERHATPERVLPDIKRTLPSQFVKRLMAGDDVRTTDWGLYGFGLIGSAGAGKTMCLATIVRTRTLAILQREMAARTEVPSGSDPCAWHAPASFVWLNWPDRAAYVKAAVMKKDGADAIEQLTVRAMRTPLLILDDLGRERLKGNYDEDFAFGVLDRIVDTRSRGELMTLWTSNLQRAALATRYGAAFTSRLLGLAPAAELPKIQDQRLLTSKATS